MVEQGPLKPLVVGSSPTFGTNPGCSIMYCESSRRGLDAGSMPADPAKQSEKNLRERESKSYTSVDYDSG